MEFGKIVRGLATGQWDGAELEKRAISESPATAGGHLLPTPVAATVIDKARNQARVIQAGAATIPMSSATLKYPRLTADAPASWRNENATISDQAMTFDAVTFQAQSLAVLVKISWELFDDADAANELVSNAFARVIALELDRAALRGSGTPPEPRGIRNQTGVTITSHGTNGSTIGSPPSATVMGWEFLVDSVAAIRTANFEPTGIITHPRTEQGLAKLRDTTNQPLQPPAALNGFPRYPTAQIPINLTVGTSGDTSEVYTADWSQCWIGVRTGFNVRFLQERFADSGQFAFLASLRADVQLAQPTAFVVDVGVRS